MAGLLVSRGFLDRFGDELRRVAQDGGLELELIVLPADPAARLEQAERERVEIAYFSSDMLPHGTGGFFSATHGAPNLKWLHVFNAGVDHPVFGGFLERGVRLTTSSGSTAEPIAQTAITGLLMLARGFPHWLEAQRRKAWDTLPADQVPPDLRGQTMVVLGLGAIGTEVARLGRALGLYVVGVRRSARRPDDPVDELHHPSDLAAVLPRCDWLAVACPLTDETRRIIDAEAIALLPRGARILNVARGEVIDEAALIAALQSGQVGGAYLDVFEQEPLPPETPLWELPNVIITPHNSAASRGNDGRAAGYFLRNLAHWGRGEPLENEVARR